MRDDGTGPRHIDISSPRGTRYTVVTTAEIVSVHLSTTGAIRAGRAPRPDGAGGHLNSDGKILPLELFEFTVGEPGYVRWAEPDLWIGGGFETAVVLWIDAERVSWL